MQNETLIVTRPPVTVHNLVSKQHRNLHFLHASSSIHIYAAAMMLARLAFFSLFLRRRRRLSRHFVSHHIRPGEKYYFRVTGEG